MISDISDAVAVALIKNRGKSSPNFVIYVLLSDEQKGDLCVIKWFIFVWIRAVVQSHNERL